MGNIGADERFNYTIMGDGVNLASRIESLTKEYKAGIIITEFTLAKLKRDYEYKEIESVRVKGKSEPVLIYELIGLC